MTNDLVKRLRRWAFKFCGKGEQEGLASDAMSEAADRIEKLEAALRKIAKHDMQSIAMDALRPGERIRGGGKQ